MIIGEGKIETRNVMMINEPDPGQFLLVISDGVQWKAQAVDRKLLDNLSGSDIERILVDLEEGPV